MQTLFAKSAQCSPQIDLLTHNIVFTLRLVKSGNHVIFTYVQFGSQHSCIICKNKSEDLGADLSVAVGMVSVGELLKRHMFTSLEEA